MEVVELKGEITEVKKIIRGVHYWFEVKVERLSKLEDNQ